MSPSRAQIMMAGVIPADWTDAQNLTFKSVAELHDPPEGYIIHIQDSWWIVHPVLGAIFKQGNPMVFKERDRMLKVLDDYFPGAATVFIHHAFYVDED